MFRGKTMLMNYLIWWWQKLWIKHVRWVIRLSPYYFVLRSTKKYIGIYLKLIEIPPPYIEIFYRLRFWMKWRLGAREKMNWELNNVIRHISENRIENTLTSMRTTMFMLRCTRRKGEEWKTNNKNLWSCVSKRHIGVWPFKPCQRGRGEAGSLVNARLHF